MTGVIRRACLVAGGAAMILATAPPAVVSGDETDQHGRAAPAWTYDPDEPIEPGDLAARMRDENVPADVATRRFRVEHATSVLQVDAERRWPATFGGVWIDTATFEVRVAFTTGAAANVALLAAGFPFPAELRPVTVPYAKRDLLDVQRRLGAERDALTAAYGHVDLDVDLPANQVVVRVAPAAAADLRQRLLAAYGPVVRVETGISAPHECPPSDCEPTMYGGIHLSQSQSCVAAFTAAAGSARFALSAGHCYADTRDPDVRHAGSYYGSMTAWRMSGAVDAERVRRSGTTWRESSKFQVTGEPPRDVASFKPAAAIVVGSYVGMTGRGGTRRGYVRSASFAPWHVPNSSGFFLTDVCSGFGDSGAPVFNGRAAYGIHSGGISGACHAPFGQQATGHVSVFGAIEHAITALGVTLLSGVNTSPEAAFTWDCDQLMRCRFNGYYSGDDDGKVTSHLWSFGDGGASTEGAPTHDYLLPMRYDVTLTVKDNSGGTASVTRTIFPPKV